MLFKINLPWNSPSVLWSFMRRCCYAQTRKMVKRNIEEGKIIQRIRFWIIVKIKYIEKIKTKFRFFFVEMKIIKNFTSIKLLGNHQSREKSGKPRAVPLRWVSINFYHGVVHAKSKSPNSFMKINTFVWKLQSCPDSRNVRNFSSSKKCARFKLVWEMTQLSWQSLRKQIKFGYLYY